MYLKGNNILKVLSLFRGNYITRFYLREISHLSGIPLKTCQSTLKFLEEGKILKSKVEGKNKYFSLNLKNIRTNLYLLHAEVYQTDLLLEKYPQFKLFLKSLKTRTPIIVFGSFAKFRARNDSDLDLLIISEKELELPFYLLPFKPHQIILHEKTFLEAIKKQENLIKEVEENHIILNNHSFYMIVMWDYYVKMVL